MPISFFTENYVKAYMLTNKDKVSNVRREFIHAMLIIKPFYEKNVDISLELMDCLAHLNNDPDHDVVEAAENTDYELLSIRKKKDKNS
jgi:hypothetical protein